MNGEHLWLETNVSGDLCYLGEENCQVRFAVSVLPTPLALPPGGEAFMWSLKTAGATEPEFPRRGLKELVPCEAIDRVYHVNVASKGPMGVVLGLDYACEAWVLMC